MSIFKVVIQNSGFDFKRFLYQQNFIDKVAFFSDRTVVISNMSNFEANDYFKMSEFKFY